MVLHIVAQRSVLAAQFSRGIQRKQGVTAPTSDFVTDRGKLIL
jgi:hypothetical protein